MNQIIKSWHEKEITKLLKQTTTTHLEEPGQSRIVGHVLREVGEQYRQVEADFLGRVVEALGELHVVNLSVVVTVTAHQEEIDFLTEI